MPTSFSRDGYARTIIYFYQKFTAQIFTRKKQIKSIFANLVLQLITQIIIQFHSYWAHEACYVGGPREERRPARRTSPSSGVSIHSCTTTRRRPPPHLSSSSTTRRRSRRRSPASPADPRRASRQEQDRERLRTQRKGIDRSIDLGFFELRHPPPPSRWRPPPLPLPGMETRLPHHLGWRLRICFAAAIRVIIKCSGSLTLLPTSRQRSG